MHQPTFGSAEGRVASPCLYLMTASYTNTLMFIITFSANSLTTAINFSTHIFIIISSTHAFISNLSTHSDTIMISLQSRVCVACGP